MATTKPRAAIAVTYEAWAQEYLRSLPPEHFMEARGQATQRKITMESVDLVSARRPDFHVFNEMLVQYPVPGQKRPGHMVPDNMVVLSKEPLEAESSFNLPLEPARPFWVLEYVSKNNKRKDYDDNFDNYKKELKVPYYLTFYPDNQELTLYRLQGKKYVSVKPNRHGRLAIPDLEIEVAILDGWVRFWYRAELLPLPADLQWELDKAKERTEREHDRAERESERADELQRRLEEAERALARLRGPSPPGPGRRTNGPKPGKE